MKVRKNAPVALPIVQTSTFSFQSAKHLRAASTGKASGYVYTRESNPTVEEVAKALAQLEGAEAALLTSSGMAALSLAILSLVRAGDHLLYLQECYGRAAFFFSHLLPRYGIEAEPFSVTEAEGIEKKLRKNTKVIFLETPTNPHCHILNLSFFGKIGKEKKCWIVVDNTFATPVLQKPLLWGAHLVVHSASKFLGGHSDIIAGAICASQELIHKMRDPYLCLGSALSPFTAFLLYRGLLTLELRVKKQSENALFLAQVLEKNAHVEKVFYPGLPSHPQHQLAASQMKGFGGILSFSVRGGRKEAEKVMDRTKLFTLGASLGGVESLISLPYYTSHGELTPEEKKRAGIAPHLIRISAGIEEKEALAQDLTEALASLS